MNQADAFSKVETYTLSTTDPVLDADEIDVLLEANARTADADDVEPSEDGWVPTYSRSGVWKAIAEGWRIKAGKASSRFDFTTDAQQFRRSQVLDNCLKMEALYRRKANRSAAIGE